MGDCIVYRNLVRSMYIDGYNLTYISSSMFMLYINYNILYFSARSKSFFINKQTSSYRISKWLTCMGLTYVFWQHGCCNRRISPKSKQFNTTTWGIFQTRVHAAFMVNILCVWGQNILNVMSIYKADVTSRYVNSIYIDLTVYSSELLDKPSKLLPYIVQQINLCHAITAV